MINLEEILQELLEYLKTTRRRHYTCEDTYYNCNAHPEEPGNDSGYDEGECNCGANEYNLRLDAQIAKIEKLLKLI